METCVKVDSSVEYSMPSFSVFSVVSVAIESSKPCDAKYSKYFFLRRARESAFPPRGSMGS